MTYPNKLESWFWQAPIEVAFKAVWIAEPTQIEEFMKTEIEHPTIFNVSSHFINVEQIIKL